MTGVSVWQGGAATTGFAGFTFIDEEIPVGIIDSINTVFTLTKIPSPAAGLQLFKNGIYQTQGTDYNLVGNVITYVVGAVPQIGDAHVSSYRY